MRVVSLLVLGLVGCKTDPPVVNINTVPSVGDVAFTSAYDIEEGSSLDLVVETGAPNATVTTSELPANAALKDGIFSFTPDYSQAGLYSITFTITSGETVTRKTIGVRVLNVIHISAPALTSVAEGAAAPELTFASNDPPGTIVVYSSNASTVSGASFDPVTGKLNFSPGWRFLDDANSSSLAVLVTAEGQELDTGKNRTSSAKVLYQITEATSFKNELVPLFLFPNGSTMFPPSLPSPGPELLTKEGRNCLFCHDGSNNAYAGLDFHPNTAYDQLFDRDIASNGFKSAVCGDLKTNGVKYVKPSDPSKSLWYMKISGTDGMTGTGAALCGSQMPWNQPWNWLTTDEQEWENCPVGNTDCRTQQNCLDTDLDCKLNARLVRKARVWILAGAPKN